MIIYIALEVLDSWKSKYFTLTCLSYLHKQQVEDLSEMLQQILLQILLLNCFLQSIVLYPQTCSKRYQHCKTYRSSGEIVIIFCCPEKKKRLFLIATTCETGNIMISKGTCISMYCVYRIMKKIHKCTLYMYL